MKTRSIGNSTGFTTLEMIITVLIAALILGSMTGFMMTMTKSYEVTQDIVDIQYQAQTTMNKIVDDIMYANKVQKFEEEKGICIEVEGEAGVEYIYILRNEIDNKLYYKKQEVQGIAEADLFIPTNLFATHVTVFKTDISTLGTVAYVDISIGFKNSSKEFEISNKVAMRNKSD